MEKEMHRDMKSGLREACVGFRVSQNLDTVLEVILIKTVVC